MKCRLRGTSACVAVEDEMHLVVYTIVSLASCLVNCIQALADLSVTMPCGRGKESKYVQRHSKCPGCGVEEKENADEVPL